MKKCFILIVGVLVSFSALAQFQIQAQIRPRAEFRDGYRTLAAIDAKHAFFITQRSRLSTSFENDKLKVFVSLQDIRVWGEEEWLKDLPNSAVHEAWAEINFNKVYQLKLGRQEIILDDHRIFGNVDWEETGTAHDAAILNYNRNGWKAKLGGGFNQEKEAFFGTGYSLTNYKVLGFLWFGKTFKEKLKFSALAASDGFEAKDTTMNTLYRITTGFNLGYTTGNFNVSGSFFYQGGQHIDYSDISAYMAAISAKYSFGKVTLTTGFELISGNDGTDANNTEMNSFHTLFGTNHKFYGLMDYFLNIPADTKKGGLQDIFLKLNWEVCENLSLGLDYHNFSLASVSPAIIMPAETLPKGLGSEIDFTGTWKIANDIKMSFGYSAMFATETMEAIKGGDANNIGQWGWLMFNINPIIFKSEKKQGE